MMVVSMKSCSSSPLMSLFKTHSSATTTTRSSVAPFLFLASDARPTSNYHAATTTTNTIRKKHTINKWVPRDSNPTTLPLTSPSDSSIHSEESDSSDSAAAVVRKFYQGINGHDLASVEPLIAENCVYEDLVFPQPFVGRKAILEFFKKFIDSISTDLQFAIDDLSEEDPTAVGVTWHLEWKGKPFPLSRGCSFYRLEVVNGQRQIIYGRDSVEPAIKPGETALVAIRGVTWLLQQFPQLADWL